MDLNRYKIFLSVADSGSFTAAAAAWNYTPSSALIRWTTPEGV